MDAHRIMIQNPLISTLHHLFEDSPDEPNKKYLRDAHAMASTPVDITEQPNAYAFMIDMPGVKSGDLSVTIEDDNVLTISGERKREEEKEAKYYKQERRMGKFMRKFVLPENADVESGVTAECKDGVLTVRVSKKPPPEPKKPKVVQVQVA